jgi:hypothetical protein
VRADAHLAHRQPHLAVFGGVGQQSFGLRQPFVGLAQVAHLRGQHQLQFAILGVSLDGLARHLDGLVELFGVAPGVHLGLIAAHCRLAAHVNQLLIGGDGLGCLVLLVIHRSQPLQEDAAVVLLLGGVGSVGVRGQVHHLLVGLRGLVVATQHVQQQPLVEARFQAAGVHLARLADGGQRILILSLAALNLADAHQGAGVLRVGLGQLPVSLERLIELVVAEQCMGQLIQRARVPRLQVMSAR